jgi:predicted amidophosphoribosyltransferase
VAIVTVPYQPYLTAEPAMEVFRREFRGRYQIYKTHFYFTRDFIVKKNAFIGVSVKLKQEPGKTSFVFTYTQPSPLLVMICSLLIAGLVLLLILRASHKELEAEVQSFIENAPEFWGARPGAAGSALPSGQARSQLMTCASCRTPLPEGARFCQTCGAPALVVERERRPSCSTCGATLAEDWRFCQGCGAAVPIQLEEAPAQPSQIYCAGCGIAVPASSSFCHNCGMKTSLLAQENVEPRAETLPGSGT